MNCHLGGVKREEGAIWPSGARGLEQERCIPHPLAGAYAFARLVGQVVQVHPYAQWEGHFMYQYGR